MTRAAIQSMRAGDLRSNAAECPSFLGRNFASLQIISIRRTQDFRMQDLAEDPEDFGSCVDRIELVSH
jgi:hypothetical protein